VNSFYQLSSIDVRPSPPGWFVDYCVGQVVNDYLFRCSSEVYGREISKAGGKVHGAALGW